jgi:hypothetical protein|tara:strand:- start:511 stop:798 length:288 start_codon:yes stop_codon:yes gene_type:complete
MRISENRLRRLIRSFLQEQVVGYTAPQEKSAGDGYVDVGDISEPLSDIDPANRKPTTATQVETLTQQRQDALNKGDAVTARSIGQQLALLRKERG